jgi:dihydrofolate reductase
MNPIRFSIIAAMASNRVIGVNNTLPWRLPADLAHFKALTLGHHIIMGRKTYESLGRPLPGRTSVIITRDRTYTVPGCVVVHTLNEAMAACDCDAEAFFIGGADLYRQALELADRMYLTEVKTEVVGDAWFPEFDRARWMESDRKHYQADEKNGYDYDFVTYDRADN